MDREKFANTIFKYVVKSFDNDVMKAVRNSYDIVAEVWENIPDLYECENIPFINLYCLIFPDNKTCSIDTEGIDFKNEIKKQTKICIETYIYNF